MNNGGVSSPRSFGVEIEFVGMSNVRAAELLTSAIPGERFEAYAYDQHVNAPYDHWHCTTDGSLPDYENCAELVSRIMRTDRDSDWSVLKKVCDVLNANGAEVTKQTGFHVHVDVSDLKQSEVIRLVKAYREYEGIIDLVVSPSRRKDFNTYCGSLRGIPPQSFQKRSVTGLNDSALEGEKYWKVNTLCYDAIKTIEFRQHHGTINFHKIQAWVRFCVEFVNLARKSMPVGRLKDYNTMERRSKSFAEEIISLKNADSKTKAFFFMLAYGGVIVGHESIVMRESPSWSVHSILDMFGNSTKFNELYAERCRYCPGSRENQEAYISVFDVVADASSASSLRDAAANAVYYLGDNLVEAYKKVTGRGKYADIFDPAKSVRDAVVDWVAQMCTIHMTNGPHLTEKAVRGFFREEHTSFWSKFSSAVMDYYTRRTKVYRELMS